MARQKHFDKTGRSRMNKDRKFDQGESFMYGFLSARLEPETLEKRFRQTMLDRDKIQTIVAIAIVAFVIADFAILDFYFPPRGMSLTTSLINRGITLAASLLAIWMIQHQSQIKVFDLIVLVWAMFIISHLAIVNVFRPADTTAVVAWDILAVFFSYILLPIPLGFQLMPALFLTCSSNLIWLIFRQPSWSEMEIWGVPSAYIFANVWGIWMSSRLGRLHRRQFMLLEQEHKAQAEREAAWAEIKVLRGIIPICSNCNKVRNDTGYYEAVDAYISRYSEADFSHTICPDCFAKLYPEIYAEMIQEEAQKAATNGH
jgi:hypothetical protein